MAQLAMSNLAAFEDQVCILKIIEEEPPMCCVLAQPPIGKPSLLVKGKKKKSVRFGGVVESTFVSKRSDNVNVRGPLAKGPEDVAVVGCSPGLWAYVEGCGNKMALFQNNAHNSSDKVEDISAKESTPVISKEEVNRFQMDNFMSYVDPVSEVTGMLLTNENGILRRLPQTFIIDCVLNMMEIDDYLETEGSSCTISCRQAVSISNTTHKRQRPIIQRKIRELTNRYL
jgi:hypothetical protein